MEGKGSFLQMEPGQREKKKQSLLLLLNGGRAAYRDFKPPPPAQSMEGKGSFLEVDPGQKGKKNNPSFFSSMRDVLLTATASIPLAGDSECNAGIAANDLDVSRF